MSQRSHIAISGSTAICECSDACSAPEQRLEGQAADALLAELVPERLRDEVLLGQVERVEVDHLVVGEALALIGDTCSVTDTTPKRSSTPSAVRLSRSSSMKVSVSIFGCV